MINKLCSFFGKKEKKEVSYEEYVKLKKFGRELSDLEKELDEFHSIVKSGIISNPHINPEDVLLKLDNLSKISLASYDKFIELFPEDRDEYLERKNNKSNEFVSLREDLVRAVQIRKDMMALDY